MECHEKLINNTWYVQFLYKRMHIFFLYSTSLLDMENVIMGKCLTLLFFYFNFLLWRNLRWYPGVKLPHSSLCHLVDIAY